MNSYIESFHSNIRDELLNLGEFSNLAEVKVLSEVWKRSYNEIRLHSSLGYRPTTPEVTVVATLT